MCVLANCQTNIISLVIIGCYVVLFLHFTKKNWPKTSKHMSSVPKERAPPFRVFNLNVTFCVYLIEFLLKNAVQFSKTRALCTAR